MHGRLLTVLAVVPVLAAVIAAGAVSAGAGQNASAATTCQLSSNGQIKHLVYIQFDNTHYLRDRTNVASDLFGTGSSLDVVYTIVGVAGLIYVPKALDALHIPTPGGAHPRGV